MRLSIIGTILSIIILSMCILMQMTYIEAVRYQKDEARLLSEMRNLIDTVIDTRQLTKDDENDFALFIASLDGTYVYKISKERRVVSPMPGNPGKTITKYMPDEDLTDWVKGDTIIVDVQQVSQGFFAAVSDKMFGISNRVEPIRLAAKIR